MNFYIIQAKGTDLFKVGVTNNTFQRMQSLQTGSPYRLKLDYSLQTDRAFEIEQLILNDFSKFKLQNEWFNLPDYARRMMYTRIKDILATQDITLRVTEGLIKHKEIFSFSGLERECGIPSGTLHKLQPPFRCLPYKWVPVIQQKLDEIFRVLI